MIQISIETLKEFQKRVASMKPAPANLPSLQYLKLDVFGQKGYLTKNNIRCVCVMLIAVNSESDCPPTIMIDESILNTFVSKSKATSITIKIKDGQVHLTDGKNKTYFSLEDHTNFPKTPSYDSALTKYVFKKEHLDCIATAQSYVMDKETAGNYRFIHMGGSYMSALHTNYFYINNRFKDLPSTIFDSEIADVITKENLDVEFSCNDRHYFFLLKNIIYIFTKYEGNSPNFKPIHDKLELPGKEFIMKREDLVEFCDLASSVNKAELVHCTMEKVGNVMQFRNVDASYNRGTSKDVDMVGGELDSFKFDARLLHYPLRAIPHETLKCKTNSNCLIVSNSDSKEYFCFMGLNL